MTARSRDLDTLDLLITACDMAADIVSRGRAAYDSDLVLRLASEAVVNRLGEGIGRLTDTLLAATPEGIPTELVRGMRNRVVHEYQRIDYGLVWNTLERDIPRVRPVFVQLRREHEQVD